MLTFFLAGAVFNPSNPTNSWAECNTYVQNNPSAFDDAFFDFASIRMYATK